MKEKTVVAELKGASKSYKSGDTVINALFPTTLKVLAGELLLIIGPSGSGKTTLLSLLGCVIYPTEGEVIINNVNTTKLNDKTLAAIRLKEIGFVFQNFNLIGPLTAEQNVMLPLDLQGQSTADARKKAQVTLKMLNMSHRAKSLPKMLSGGEQQRIAIARALVTEPVMLLCDEPTASLDSKSALTVMEELKSLAEQGKAVAVVTHDMRLIPYAHRVINVSEGIATEANAEQISKENTH